MKKCQKCGREVFDEAVVCPGCGCPLNVTEYPSQKTDAKEADYSSAVSSSGITDSISVILMIVGAVVWWIVNVYAGAALFLVAELVALIPNTRFNSLFRKTSGISDRSKLKEAAKEESRRLKEKYPAFRLSFPLAIVALILLIASIAVPNFL